MTILKLLTVLISTTLALTACSKEEKPAKPATAPSASTETSPSKPAEKAAPAQSADPSAKLNAYIECSNGTIGDVHKSFDRYTQWVKDPKKAPTGKEQNVYGIYKLNDTFVARCTNEALTATKAQPAMPELDKAVTDYVAALKEYSDISGKASTYYEQGNYKDDKFAQGIAMHPELVAAYDKFEIASKAFNTELDTVNSKAQAEELAQIEKTEGKKYHYWALATSMTAKKLADITSQEKFDVTAADAAFAEFEKNSKELDAVIKAGGKDVPITAGIINSPMNEFLIAAKERIRFVRDGKKYSQSDIMRMNGNDTHVVGSDVSVNARYNDFIQQFNLLK